VSEVSPKNYDYLQFLTRWTGCSSVFLNRGDGLVQGDKNVSVHLIIAKYVFLASLLGSI
jgi:hypothetical protein